MQDWGSLEDSSISVKAKLVDVDSPDEFLKFLQIKSMGKPLNSKPTPPLQPIRKRGRPTPRYRNIFEDLEYD